MKGIVVLVFLLLLLSPGCIEEIEAPFRKETTPTSSPPQTTITSTTSTTSTTLDPVVAMMVRIRDFKARPETVTITRQNGVTWMNDDPVDHNIAFDDFSSGPLRQGEMYTHVFNETGVYYYYCSIHKRYLKGTIIVT